MTPPPAASVIFGKSHHPTVAGPVETGLISQASTLSWSDLLDALLRTGQLVGPFTGHPYRISVIWLLYIILYDIISIIIIIYYIGMIIHGQQSNAQQNIPTFIPTDFLLSPSMSSCAVCWPIPPSLDHLVQQNPF